jgi:hypothetical protein
VDGFSQRKRGSPLARLRQVGCIAWLGFCAALVVSIKFIDDVGIVEALLRGCGITRVQTANKNEFLVAFKCTPGIVIAVVRYEVRVSRLQVVGESPLDPT